MHTVCICICVWLLLFIGKLQANAECYPLLEHWVYHKQTYSWNWCWVLSCNFSWGHPPPAQNLHLFLFELCSHSLPLHWHSHCPILLAENMMGCGSWDWNHPWWWTSTILQWCWFNCTCNFHEYSTNSPILGLLWHDFILLTAQKQPFKIKTMWTCNLIGS